MVLVVQRGNKIVEDLQVHIHTKVPKNEKMCKEKWNGFNSDYKMLLYHKGTKNHILFLGDDDRRMWQTSLTSPIQQKNYEIIKVFQGEQIINASLHVKDLQVEGDGSYIASILGVDTWKEQDFAKLLPHSFVGKLLGDHCPYEQLTEPKQHNSQNAKAYFVNLDDVVNNPQ